MKHSMTRNLYILLFSMASMLPQAALAADEQLLPDVREGIVSIKTMEPERRIGYTVGDILERTVTLEIRKPYKLIETSLPIVGYERRWKGQVIGIELHAIRHQKEEHADSVTHTIHLAYQIFTNNIVAKPAALPAEYLQLINGKEVVKYRIPSWEIAISPLSIYGSVKIEADMSPLRGPLLLDDSREQLGTKIAATVLTLSLLGLLYIWGRRAWLPFMGRPFGRTYRKLRKLPGDEAGLRQAVSGLHEAINTTAGHSVFGGTLEQFLAGRPAFVPVKADLEQFFAISRHVFFRTVGEDMPPADAMKWLQAFCRRCRDCERGLVPDSRPHQAA